MTRLSQSAYRKGGTCALPPETGVRLWEGRLYTAFPMGCRVSASRLLPTPPSPIGVRQSLSPFLPRAFDKRKPPQGGFRSACRKSGLRHFFEVFIAPLRLRRRQAKAAPRRLSLSLSKKWLAPLFRGFHSSLAPTARPGSYAEKPLLRKAFCGFAVHAAKSDYSLRGLRPPNPQGFFDSLSRLSGSTGQAVFLFRKIMLSAVQRRPCQTPPFPSAKTGAAK